MIITGDADSVIEWAGTGSSSTVRYCIFRFRVFGLLVYTRNGLFLGCRALQKGTDDGQIEGTFGSHFQEKIFRSMKYLF
jgi:hypothetical protein